MLNNDNNLFDIVLLFALPASGKSEIRHFLANVEPERLQKEFHFGETLQLDDFPYVHFMRRIDQECDKLGQKRIYFPSDDAPMYNACDYAMLFMLLNEDYHDLINRVKIKPDSAALWMFDRMDNASLKVEMLPRMGLLASDIRNKLALALEEEALDLLKTKLNEYPENFNNKTIILEAARGGKHGSSFPLQDPEGYQFSLRYLCPEILEKACILYIDVTPEESRRKNEHRTDPNDPGSILNHGVSIEVMMNDYGTCDMKYLIENSEVKDTVTVKAHGKTYHLPIGVFDNNDDKTTHFRQDASLWRKDKIEKFFADVKKVTDVMFENYKKKIEILKGFNIYSH